MQIKKFRFYDMAPYLFYQDVLKGDVDQPTMVREWDDGKKLTITLHERHVRIEEHEWTANHRKVVTLKVTPDAAHYSTNGFCQCTMEVCDINTHELVWSWKKYLKYEMEDVDDLLRQFFKPEELAGLLLRYGIILNRAS
jgi:hypothetical protein